MRLGARKRLGAVLTAVSMVTAVTGCGGAEREPGPRRAAEPGGWWRPAPGAAADWDWQIAEPYDLSAPRAMYDLDLFDLAPAGSRLRYPDGSSAEVPRGSLAGWIARLHARTPRPVVICYLDTGAYEDYRPDAHRFPGHPGTGGKPPDRPRPPAPGSVIGWNTGWDGERWLDLRPASRRRFAPLVWARLDLAKRMGCDGVEPDQNNPVGNDPGFPISPADQISWYREVAEQAHARGLSVGMKNGHDQPGAVAALVDAFDWALPEECAELDECGLLRPFVQRGKAVFAVDYGSASACGRHRAQGLDGLVKDEPPTGAKRVPCGPGR